MVLLTDFSDVVGRGYTGFPELLEEHYGIPAEETKRRFMEGGEDNSLWWNACRGLTRDEPFWYWFVKDDRYQELAQKHLGRSIKQYEVSEIFYTNIEQPIQGTYEVYTRIKSYPDHISKQELCDGRSAFSGRERGMPPIVVVSDQTAQTLSIVNSYHQDFLSLIHQAFWSVKLKKIKRDPEFFEIVLQELEQTPEHVIYIDDNPLNLAAAQEHGIHNVILFTNAAELENRLKTEYYFEFYDLNP